MGAGFNWFKKYKIEERDSGHWYSYFTLEYIGGGSTSHSYENISKVQNLLETITGKRIPAINDEYIDFIDYDLELIEPDEMSDMCSKVLATVEVDEADMRYRIEWFKKLSDEGYYLTYDML